MCPGVMVGRGQVQAEEAARSITVAMTTIALQNFVQNS